MALCSASLVPRPLMQRVIVYPSYVNASLSVSQGRRVPKVPGAEDPTAPEIYDCVVSALKLPAEIEVGGLPWCMGLGVPARTGSWGAGKGGVLQGHQVLRSQPK